MPQQLAGSRESLADKADRAESKYAWNFRTCSGTSVRKGPLRLIMRTPMSAISTCACSGHEALHSNLSLIHI
eukprot:9679743-Alexandrium_andersonii.AAC.1